MDAPGTAQNRPVTAAVRTGGIAEAMPLEPAFLFSKSLLQAALPELLAQTGTSGRHFAQLLIRVWQETRQNDFPEIERAAEEAGGRRMPLSVEDLMEICHTYGLRLKWSEGERAADGLTLLRARYEAPGTLIVNRRMNQQEERLKYELAFFLGHQVLHGGDGMISPHTASGILGDDMTGQIRPGMAATCQPIEDGFVSGWPGTRSCDPGVGSRLCRHRATQRNWPESMKTWKDIRERRLI